MALSPRIVIVGCGAAGFSAACKFLENGFTNITILEAENRIGGRVHSVLFGDGIVDLGAQWCHGQKNNIIYNLVKDLHLLEPSVCTFKNLEFFDSQGNLIDKYVTDMLFNMLEDISENDILFTYSGSFGDYVIKNYEEKLRTQHPKIDQLIAKLMLEWYGKMQNNLNGCSNWFDLSNNFGYIECQGNQSLGWKNKGYKAIFSVLMKDMPIDEKILLNKEVTKIIWNNKEIVVKCADGFQYKADHVIVTVSLGVLKYIHTDLFTPELPNFKKNAIEGISFGHVDKILLKFPNKWWKDTSGFNILWSNEDEKNILKEFPEGSVKDEKSWLTAFYSFYPIEYNSTVLLAFINGEFCKNIEYISDDLIIKGCMYILNKFIGKEYKNIPNPDSILRSEWVKNKHFYGSYSYRSLETEKINTSAEELGKPLGSNELLFAGEATHPIHYSTVHGAIESGFREAQRIISLYK